MVLGENSPRTELNGGTVLFVVPNREAGIQQQGLMI